jgi:hypothetical protein
MDMPWPRSSRFQTAVRTYKSELIICELQFKDEMENALIGV